MTDKLVTLASYSDLIQAQLANQRLEAAGIPTYINDDIPAGNLDGLDPGVAPVKLDVAVADAERARQLLAAPLPADAAAQEQLDEVDPPEDLNSSESLAEHAWRAALLGCITIPVLVHLFSLWLAFKIARRDDTLSDTGTRKLWGALAIDGVVLLATAIIVRVVFIG